MWSDEEEENGTNANDCMDSVVDKALIWIKICIYMGLSKRHREKKNMKDRKWRDARCVLTANFASLSINLLPSCFFS